MDERLPIEEVLPGQTLHPLEEGAVPLMTFALIKVLDQSGEVSWSFRTSEPPNLEKLLGALTVQVDVLRRKLAQGWDED